MVLAVVMVFAISGAFPQWTLTDATAVRAEAVNGGVRISAFVNASACQEAEIVAYSGGIPTEFQIVARTKPEDIGRMCIRPTAPVTVSHWFPVKGPIVTVRTAASAIGVPVKP